ncbi:DUF3021 domain-containing protein [Clostridium folliculivorans]|uniref:DUF3021 domain-containing protein n=1 Tax=Clostridium folliculivorans TaxID=2886038 RepID=A0A9W6DCE4_9CLOT|nr:DUF3021 domain-containing protein [Clostridium folliculivorans]GKU26658.1 hypothetical protein CFOLD11_34850 [Clostridium folliculivorans]GKU28910.1 hypothetical protein CFB3_10160 [Clostridium folliculivorans]
MKINEYLKFMLKDFLKAFGFLMIIVTIYFSSNSITVIETSLLWQIILVSSAYVFFKFAFVNKYDLDKKTQNINLFVCSTLADVAILAWLWLFSPNRAVDSNTMILYAIIIFSVKVLVFSMMHIDGQSQAKQLNEKLNEYKKESASKL